MSNGQMTVPLVIRMAAGARSSWRHHSHSLEGLYAHFPGLQGGHAIQSGR